jgi:hypothetical protein
MSIENRNLAVGTKLVARYKGHEYGCVVTAHEGDKVGYKMECPDHPDLHGKEFKSPSSAGSAIMGGSACNGWRFWSVVGSEEAKPKKTSKKAAKKNGNPGNGLIERMEDGRYFCSACQEAFDAPAGVEPQGCPKGHTLEGRETA